MGLISLCYPINGDGFDECSFQVGAHVPSAIRLWVAEWLAERIANGAVLTDGKTIQFGFWTLRCEIEERQLQLQAPYFVNGEEQTDLVWQPDLSEALRSMMVHKYMPDSFAAKISIPNMSHTARVGQQFGEFPMLIDRVDPADDDTDSGWTARHICVDQPNEAAGQVSIVPLWVALQQAPWILDYLSLPAGMQVRFSADSAQVLRDHEPAPVGPGSYFDSLQRD